MQVLSAAVEAEPSDAVFCLATKMVREVHGG